MTSSSNTDAIVPRRRLLWIALKWLLFALVLGFVGKRIWDLWQRDREALLQAEVDWEWLALAGLCYAVAWLPSVWFWRTLMTRLGARLSFLDTARAYYCGHLGKYVPGKATVMVIRAALLRHSGFRPAPAALTVAIETLVMMGAGAAVAVALTPFVLADVRFPDWPRWGQTAVSTIASKPVLTPALVLAALLVALPILSQLFSRFAERMTPRDVIASRQGVTIGNRLLATGLAAFIPSWCVMGLSLGCTLRAVGVPLTAGDWPLWTGAVAAATVLGFAAVFAPAGMGVREAVLIAVLSIQPEIGEGRAVIAAVFLRVVWFATEILAAFCLYWLIRPTGDERLEMRDER